MAELNPLSAIFKFRAGVKKAGLMTGFFTIRHD